MNKVLFNIYRIVVPKPLRTIILKKNLRKRILQYFDSLPAGLVNEEQKEVIEYLRLNPVEIFPYPFHALYSPDNVVVHNDKANRMHYVVMDGKKLYFKKRWSVKRIRKGYSELLREQDINSPHRYLTRNFQPDGNDIVADIGAAEGNFSLSVVEKVKKIYIFEYNRQWAEALRQTFSLWKDKVEIICKKVADFEDDNHITIDSFLREKNDLTFIKIDVEGAEKKVLGGCSDILKARSPLKIAICTYHNNNDGDLFTSVLEENGFSVTCSKGYMIHYYDKQIKAPYLRRGLVRAVRK